MAFTNYLVQATVIWVLSKPLGVKLHEYAYVAASVALFSTVLVFSHLWLARFRVGPAEWLWRMATYARREPLHRSRRVPHAAVIA